MTTIVYFHFSEIILFDAVVQSFKVSKFKILFSAALFHHNKTLFIFNIFESFKLSSAFPMKWLDIFTHEC